MLLLTMNSFQRDSCILGKILFRQIGNVFKQNYKYYLLNYRKLKFASLVFNILEGTERGSLLVSKGNWKMKKLYKFDETKVVDDTVIWTFHKNKTWREKLWYEAVNIKGYLNYRLNIKIIFTIEFKFESYDM